MIRYPPGHDDAPITSTMDRHELAELIRADGIWDVALAFGDFGRQVVAGVRDGVNMAGWEARAVKGVIRFARVGVGADGIPSEGVVYINSDDPDTVARIRGIAVPYPVIVITRREGKGGDVDPGVFAMYRQRYGHLL